jgi:hypothetical protein
LRAGIAFVPQALLLGILSPGLFLGRTPTVIFLTTATLLLFLLAALLLFLTTTLLLLLATALLFFLLTPLLLFLLAAHLLLFLAALLLLLLTPLLFLLLTPLLLFLTTTGVLLLPTPLLFKLIHAWSPPYQTISKELLQPFLGLPQHRLFRIDLGRRLLFLMRHPICLRGRLCRCWQRLRRILRRLGRHRSSGRS